MALRTDTLSNFCSDIKTVAIEQGATLTETINPKNLDLVIKSIPTGGTPPITTGGMFTGATIPLTYKDNTHTSENNYEYKSVGYNITITGLDGRATITGNGTKEVSVAFDVTSAISSLAEFTISLSDGTNTYECKGLHAHYGTTVTGILTLAYTNIPRTGTGTIGTEYKFIETADTDLPCFSSYTTLWNTIYSYQVLNVLIGNFSSTNIGDSFLYYCLSFNQPLDLSGVTRIGNYFLRENYSFNQPLDIGGVGTIGISFLEGCRSFNQPLDLSGVSTIGSNFLDRCSSFNQPLDLSGVSTIGGSFLSTCYSFNQPLDLSGVSTIGGSFLSSCYSFNQPLDLSGVSTIGNIFLSTCYSFNQPLDLSGVSTIGYNFLDRCYSFNQPLDLSGVSTIGSNFLRDCNSFNQPLDISNITTIGTSFLNSCNSLSTIIYNSTTFPTDNDSLSQTSNTKTNTTNGAGIIVYGTQRAGLLLALPNRTTSPYRKLIDGGAD